MLDGTEFFECSCHSPEHTLRFVLDLDPEDPGIHTEVYLGSYPWGWQRVWVGIRYIFGYKSRHGAWDCFLLKPEDAPRLRGMLKKLEAVQRLRNESPCAPVKSGSELVPHEFHA